MMAEAVGVGRRDIVVDRVVIVDRAGAVGPRIDDVRHAWDRATEQGGLPGIDGGQERLFLAVEAALTTNSPSLTRAFCQNRCAGNARP